MNRPTSTPIELLDRTPPHSLEAEKAVLGSILLMPEACDEVALLIRPSDYYSDAHEIIFSHMLALHEDGTRVDITLLVSRLKDAGQLDAIGGIACLADIAECTATASNAEYYARIVRDKATLRNLALAAQEQLADAYAPGAEPRELLSKADTRLTEIYDNRSAGGAHPLRAGLQQAAERINSSQVQAFGLATGWPRLDALTGGLHPGELVIVAARPSVGKTSLALNLANYVAVDKHDAACTLIVSLEMSEREVAQRMLAARANVNTEKFSNGGFTEDERDRLAEAMNQLDSAPIHVDDSPSRTVAEIASDARRLKRKSNLRLVIIDYLQLLEPDNPRDSRQEQVAKMARRLKGLARELNVPVVCLSQLNRQPENAKETRPRLSHLRESGAIEQDADVVIFLHRERAKGIAVQSVSGIVELIIAKQRNGPQGMLQLWWNGQFARFESLNAQQHEHSDWGAPTEAYAP